MSKRSYTAQAAGVKQVNTITVANTWATNDTVTITIDNIDVVITIGTLVTTAQVATTIKQVFNGETLTDTSAAYTPNSGVQSMGQFAEIEATVSSSVVTLTARTASKPFTLTVTESTAGSGTATGATSVACTGPTFFSQQDNWTANTVPVDADDIVFAEASVSCQDGLSPAIQPGTLYHYMTFTGKIGRPQKNIDNAAKPYYDYRTTSLTFDDNAGATANYQLGLGEGQGAELIRLDTGAGRSNFKVYRSRQMVGGVPNVLLRGTNANNTLINLDGTVGIAFYSGESTTLVALTNGREESASNAYTICGPDATLTSCVTNLLSGTVETNSALSTTNVRGGKLIHYAGAISTLNVYAKGVVKIRSAAITITTGYIDGTLDLSESSSTITFTNCHFGPNAVVIAPSGNIAFTNPYTEEDGFSPKRKLNFGTGRTYAVV